MGKTRADSLVDPQVCPHDPARYLLTPLALMQRPSAPFVYGNLSAPCACSPFPDCDAENHLSVCCHCKQCQKSMRTSIFCHRSTLVMPDGSRAILMAGPMRDWDWLYLLSVLLTVVIVVAVFVAIFGLDWFSVQRLRDRQESGGKLFFPLYDSQTCEGNSTTREDNSTTREDNSTTGEDSELVCFGMNNSLGKWVLAVQVLAPLCVGPCVSSLVLQLVNFACRPRHLLLHVACLYCMMLAGVLLAVTGHMVHNRSVWADLVWRHDALLRTEPLVSGLFLFCSVLAASICVLVHVSSRSPGPLSVQSCIMQDPFSRPLPTLLDLEMGRVEGGEAGHRHADSCKTSTGKAYREGSKSTAV